MGERCHGYKRIHWWSGVASYGIGEWVNVNVAKDTLSGLSGYMEWVNVVIKRIQWSQLL